MSVSRRQALLAGAVVWCMASVPQAETQTQDLHRDALAAMQAKSYREAEKLLRRHLDQHPNDPTALYDLARVRGRLGDPDEAAELLESAWQAGLRGVERMRSDPDLQALLQSPRGRRLLDSLEKLEEERRRWRGEPLLFDATVVAAGRVVLPEKRKKSERYPLVVALHGHGGSPELLAGMFLAAGLSPQLVVLAPYGPYTVPLADGMGYSWYQPGWLFDEALARQRAREPAVPAPGAPEPVDTARLRLVTHEQEVGGRYVLAAIEAALREYPIDPERVFLLGHSQGGDLAYGLALRHPDRFRGLIVIGARLRAGSPLEAATGRLRVLVCHSPDDAVIAFSEGRAAQERLEAAGVESRLLRYEGGHGLTAGLVQEVARWIDRAS